jgi:hypothetical protein
MPAKSKKQQMAAGAALAAKRGEKSKGSLRGASKSMASSMSEKELERMASAKETADTCRRRKVVVEQQEVRREESWCEEEQRQREVEQQELRWEKVRQ